MKLLNARKKLVTLAVASAVTAGAAVMSAPAHAMNVSQNNLGQVLLFPYYTVKNGYDSIFSVVNTSDRTVVFKVRFREALNSREVRDFNVILSPYDVWTAGITKSGDGALVRTFDNTCTSPILPGDTTGGRSVDFTNAGFTNTNPASAFRVDGGGTEMTRVQEGYFEVIAMAQSIDDGSAVSTNVVEYNAKHVSGVPRDCSKVDAAMLDAPTILANFQTAGARFQAPGNVLKGAVSYIDVATGKAVDANPTAIENWVTGAGAWTVAHNVFAAGSLQPDLSDGDVGATARYLQNGAVGAVVVPASEDAVSALLSATNVINEYAANGTGTFTDWVVTFPTKHHYTDLAYTIDAGLPPFAQNFAFDTDGNAAAAPYTLRGKSCDTISMPYYNREEASRQGGTQFSPVTSTSSSLCYEANVITFNSSNVFGTGINHKNLVTTDVGVSGWANLGLTNTGNVAAGFTGLPVIGFAAINRNNASEAGNNRNYGSGVPHAYSGGKP
jgi:hypothetical protein